MSSIDAYIYIIIGLLGVAYPILLQVVARLEEKYSSDIILKIFKQELEFKLFTYSLITAISFLVIWTLKLPKVLDINYLSFIIDNSAALLLALSSIVNIISFFLFVRKILIYYTPSEFILHLIKHHDKTVNNLSYFHALSDLLLLYIKYQHSNYSLTLSRFFYTAFKKIRNSQINEPVVYPDAYYELVYKAIEELAILKEKRNYILEHRTSGEIWLLGEYEKKEISEITYKWMWRNLLLAIRYKQDDLIINHWESCNNFFCYNLNQIDKIYDPKEDNFQPINQEAVDKRLKERHKFIEFHYALGGLLTYKQRYDCIKRVFSYTQDEPPKYYLLPDSMDDIFKFFFELRDPYDQKYTWISSQYHFPDLSGLGADFVIKKWIMSYMAILFLRQYTIYPYLSTMKPLDLPQAPNKQGDIKQWIDGLDFFKVLVSEHLDNTSLLTTLGLNFITQDWCDQNQKPFPIDFIESLKSILEKEYKANAISLQLSPVKIQQFNNKTKSIIEKTIESIKQISNKQSKEDDYYNKWYVSGEKMLQSKYAFSDTTDTHYINYDSILASEVSQNLIIGLSETFIYKVTKYFLLKSEDIFKAIDKLAIDNSYIIINFGLSLDYFIDHIKVEKLSTDNYKNIRIFSFNGSHLIKDSLMIIKSADFPIISTMPIEQDLIKKYKLEKISDSIDLYTSLIDLNNASEEIKMEYNHNISEEELKKSALLTICISTEIKWKKNATVIHISQYSDYFQKGIANSLSDIEPLK